MRVLITSTPVATHFLPMLPLIRALGAAGHEVLVAGQPDVTGPARDAGLETATFGDAFHAVDLRRGRLPEGVRPIEVLGRPPAQQIDGAAQMWRNHAPYFLYDYLELAREWRADLILSEHMEYAGPVIGKVLGVPSVWHRWGTAPTSEFMLGQTRMWLGPLCERLGLDSVPAPDLVLDPAPPALAGTDAPDALPVRPVPHTGEGSPWRWSGPSGRRVVVALGGYALELGGAALVRRIADALGAAGGVEAVVSAPETYRAAIGALPAGLTYTGRTAPGLLFPGADLVVHHGGPGSTLGAAALGVPQLVLPQLGDAFVAGDRVAAAGAGITLDSAAAQNSDRELGRAVTALLTGDAYRKAAGRVRAQIEAMPGAEVLVPLLAGLTTAQEVTA
ncbi:nucleotide disphospho-sugar-binding domain-containing protein [Streptomyces sp. RKAG290]|uniref:nucleotide disphospho-sugar-binding domain-containing protein n=1 Tax=Streptomyces sp. RKAG290 TaxID=2888348 RepID=UPI00203434D6|nr:nucleotide disphospho-sugar-binding domain-containing protein [Streptomyces sp. RKAG290]MCM2414161.1 glycosyl transferase [Streptomyces sp. RKAG290]